MRTGLRYAANNRHLRATLMRSLAFFPFASAYWALLPLVARSQMAQGPELYGVLLGAIGVGAIGGSFALNWLKAKLGPIASSQSARSPRRSRSFCLASRASPRHRPQRQPCRWRFVDRRDDDPLRVGAGRPARLGARARARDLPRPSIFGAMTIGSARMGACRNGEGLCRSRISSRRPAALLAIPLTWRWKLQTAAGIDLSPSMHWRTPVVAKQIEQQSGAGAGHGRIPRRPKDNAPRSSARSTSSDTSASATARSPGASSKTRRHRALRRDVPDRVLA